MKSYKEIIKQANEIFSDLQKNAPLQHAEESRQNFINELIEINYNRLYNYFDKIDKEIHKKD